MLVRCFVLSFLVLVKTDSNVTTSTTGDDKIFASNASVILPRNTDANVTAIKLQFPSRTPNISPNTTQISTDIMKLNYKEFNGIKLRGKGKFLAVFHVVTCDGFVLDIFRMQKSKTTRRSPKYPVLLFHGMLQSSDRFVEQGKEKGVAFKLHNLGYDVWLGNSRGNKYGRLHLYLEPDMYDEKYTFFNYSYEEIGLYDVAAIVDRVLEETGSDKLHYIGHSQGGTAFLALNTLDPKYNKKFVTAHLLAPIGYQNNFVNDKILALTAISDVIYYMLLNLGVLEVFPYNKTISPPYESADFCLGDRVYQDVCRLLNVTYLMGLNTNKFNRLDTRGGSIKQMAHYGQNIRSKMFRRWDYGVEQNKVIYGTNEPPKFDLSLVTVKTGLHYALNDEMVNAKDVIAMARDMPNARTREVGRSSFKHSDFLDANDVMECVYETLIQDMNNWPEGKETENSDSSTKLSLSLILNIIPLVAFKIS